MRHEDLADALDRRGTKRLRIAAPTNCQAGWRAARIVACREGEVAYDVLVTLDFWAHGLLSRVSPFAISWVRFSVEIESAHLAHK
jgi:hypothetical protein